MTSNPEVESEKKMVNGIINAPWGEEVTTNAAFLIQLFMIFGCSIDTFFRRLENFLCSTERDPI